MRKTIIVAAAAALVVSGIVMSPAPKAEAHHNTITVSVACVNYQWVATWGVENSENLVETITATSDPANIPVGTEIGKRAIFTFTEVFAAPVDKVLSLTGKWSNNQTQSNTGKLNKSQFEGTCEQPPPPTPEDASASATPEPATCEAPGAVTFTVVNAHWLDETDTTDGERVAVADEGHLFPGKLTELTVTYQVNPELAGEDCGEHEACPGVAVCPTSTPTPSVTAPAECDPAKGECFAATGPLTPEDTARLWFLGLLGAGAMLLGGGLWWNARRNLTAE